MWIARPVLHEVGRAGLEHQGCIDAGAQVEARGAGGRVARQSIAQPRIEDSTSMFMRAAGVGPKHAQTWSRRAARSGPSARRPAQPRYAPGDERRCQSGTAARRSAT